MSRTPPSWTAPFAALALAAACGAPEEPVGPRWVELARGFAPVSLLPLVQEWQRNAGVDPTSAREEFVWVRFETTLPRAAWSPGTEPGTWSAALPAGAFRRGMPGVLRLDVQGSASLAEAPPGAPLPPGTLRTDGERIVVHFGGEPPDEVHLVDRVESGRRTSDGVWQVRLRDEFAAGIPVWSGAAEELTCDVPAGSRLSFDARYATRAGAAPVVLRVRLDGTVVHEERVTSAELAAPGRKVSLVLPRAARRGARVRFEVEGPPGVALFLRPVIGPADVGTPAARPWPGARPDLVLFLADTLRADALASGGGTGDLAPNVERFAAGALRFRAARANAAWTLPSISTLLTGLAPGQHTANDTDRSLPTELTTIAEALAGAGYRTAAVTDAAFFTPLHGLDQGFETFVQNQPAHWDLDWTLARASEQLAVDDGRPLFLVVHTYRTHLPYRVGPEELRARWDLLLRDGCALMKERKALAHDEWKARLAGCAPRFRELYQDGVRDLDRGFGEFRSAFEASGRGAHGYLLFTSDHGEALGENDDIFHGGELWESKLRIPLLVSGPGLAARDVDVAVTLLDVTPTLAALAGLAPDPLWSGASLLTVDSERPACAFRLQSTSQVALVAAHRKVFAASVEDLERGELQCAFELEGDPREAVPITDATWPAVLARTEAPRVRTLLAPAANSVAAPASPEHAQELRQLGYGGEDADH